jgi:hypothetical protein
MGVREQYLTILAEDGRRVANRFAFSSLYVKGSEQKDGAWSEAFYGMYGPDDQLPEDERSREGNPANTFDPTGWFQRYNINTRLRMADTSLDKTSRDWPLELRTSTPQQVEYLTLLFESAEARLEANDEWMDLMESLNEADFVTLFILFNGRWPSPVNVRHDSTDRTAAAMLSGLLGRTKTNVNKESE